MDTNRFKNIGLLIFCVSLFLACGENTSKKDESKKDDSKKDEVIVLGTIHGGHRRQEIYSLDKLTALIKEINPDIILTEIPPDRFDIAMEGFKRDDSISEPRVRVFPEYTDVIFPLTKTMNFTIIPTAGWTSYMNNDRSRKLRAIRQDSSRAKDWKAYQDANKLSDSLMKLAGNRNDPYFIHTNTYDSITNIGLGKYNKLFNDELGLGGWENINIAHYWNIEKALNEYKNQGKRILITYGAGHKGWFLKELRKRDDIKLLDVKPFLDKLK